MGFRPPGRSVLPGYRQILKETLPTGHKKQNWRMLLFPGGWDNAPQAGGHPETPASSWDVTESSIVFQGIGGTSCLLWLGIVLGPKLGVSVA